MDRRETKQNIGYSEYQALGDQVVSVVLYRHFMKSMREEGLRLIREAEGILRRDAQGALKDKDFNLVGLATKPS